MANPSKEAIGVVSQFPPDRKLNIRGGSAWICCPNPEHSGGNESTPSLKINLEANGRFPLLSFYCFGCGFAGNINALLETLGLPRLSGPVYSAPTASITELPDMSEMLPWPDKEWRGISGDCLQKMGAMYGTLGNQNMLYLPVYTFSKHVGGIWCRTSRKGKWQKSYFNVKGPWANEALYEGYRVKRGKKVLWVVEGPRDCLNITQHGGAAVALMGSNVSATKIRRIIDLDPDIILAATDPDSAGRKAFNSLKEGIAGRIPVKKVPFAEGVDPADLSKKHVKALEKSCLKSVRKGRAA